MESTALTYNSYGEPSEVLQLTKHKINRPKHDQVLVKILAAPIHPSDMLTVIGFYPIQPPLPAVAGNEGVGEVIECGPRVSTLKKGDIVFPVGVAVGMWQTHLCLPECDWIRMDKRLPIDTLAVIGLNPSTAYRMLMDFVKLEPGDVIMQNGSNSAVGVYVIQMARNMGVKTINLFRERATKEATEATRTELMQYGATWAITDLEFADETNPLKLVIKNTAPKLGFNCLGGEPTLLILNALASDGILVNYGVMTGQPMPIPVGVQIFKNISLHGFWITRWVLKSDREEREKMFRQFTDWLLEGKLRASDCVRVPFSEWPKAIELSSINVQKPVAAKRKAVLFMS